MSQRQKRPRPNAEDALQKYNVVFNGELAPGKEAEAVKTQLSVQFNMDRAKIERVFAHTPFTVKEQVDYQTALKFQILFEWAGAICQITPEVSAVNASLFNSRQQWNVICEGKIFDTHRITDVKNTLKEYLHLNEKRIEKLFSGHPVVIMQEVNYYPALKIQTSFELAGVICRMEQAEDKEDETAAEENLFLQPAHNTIVCPKCGARQLPTRRCRECGCYIAKYLTRKKSATPRRTKPHHQQLAASLKNDLSIWGIGFIIFGIVQLAIIGWGALGIIGIGIINLLIHHKALFLVNGFALVFTGVFNSYLTTMYGFLDNVQAGFSAGIGDIGLITTLAGLLIFVLLQIAASLYAFRQFKEYTTLVAHPAQSRKKYTSR
ncbi:hypothetical protein GF339_13555 [candidate division KSB3 bacterium]|uniref:Uncharacterized protein n=1 Tax=candidate division KSB3 bacterium TaxID=2044937 RepID=A0A9D5Q6D2_9BACT|nr:hypothetical protein [candidate division KSB3 bacterium]MBD3325605.1 hypothetical protein [candidate division KSB3 bacterium]